MSKVWLETGSASGLGRNIAEAVLACGRLDVVVNNAGYADIAPFEQLSAERFKAVVDTNFYGVVNVCRVAIPIMRKQKSGCVLQISSVGGRVARPGNSPYHAAKWAVGGFTESLAQELAPFGVKVCALEPGGMRTNWGARANQDTPDLLPDYEPSVGSVVRALASYWGHETSDAAKHAGDAEATRAADAERWRDISVSTDFDARGALPDVRF